MTNGRYQSNKAWWKAKTAGRELFFAAVDQRYPAGMRPRPENVEHEFSCGFGQPIRYYAFATAEAADEFVQEWTPAIRCKDPLR